MLLKNLAILEINPRLLQRRQSAASILDIQDSYWEKLSSLGINYIWLMGVWKIPESSIKKYCFEEGLVEEYKNALHNFNENDVAGSPYAIEDYKINPLFGESNETLLLLKKKLNSFGMKLILDFIPNHFNAESGLLKTNPDIFLKGTGYQFEENPRTFFRSPFNETKIFAHGKDPNFEAWQDTAQINIFSDEARQFLTDRLLETARLCDGVRCDMAMLVLKNVFDETWGKFPIDRHSAKSEFWKDIIGTVKNTFPEFLFIAEAYWDREWDLQQLGFDYTYDKRLYDRLIEGNVQNIKNHLKAEENFQKKSLRFIENHDEKRALEIFGKEKSEAAAVIISTIPGMRFYFDGQCTGKKIKLPVQLNREPYEIPDEELHGFYENLLGIVKEFEQDDYYWKMIETFPAWEGNYSNDNFLVWQIKSAKKNFVVCVNYSGYTSQCRIFPQTNPATKNIIFNDLLNKEQYTRATEDFVENGLYVELKAYNSHVFLLNY